MAAEPRPITDDDLAALVELNNSEVPNVGPLDVEKATRLIALCDQRWAIGEPLDAFCLTLGPEVDYWSPNYRWVSTEFESFTYLDRVCVAHHLRRQGLGQRLYRAVEAGSTADWFVLEVNTRPLNRQSLDFHAALGFHEVGRGEPYGDGTEVAYLAKALVS